jgi:hypothetical protein
MDIRFEPDPVIDMLKKSLLAGVGILAVVLALHAGTDYFLHVPQRVGLPGYLCLLMCAAFGRVALLELRRTGKDDLAWAIKLILAVLVVPVMLHPGPLSVPLLGAAALVLLLAAGAACWYRYRGPVVP